MAARVLFPFVGDSVGGSHISASLLIRALDQKRYKPIVMLHEAGPLSEYFQGLGMPHTIVPLPALAGKTSRLRDVLVAQIRSAPRMRSVLKKEGISIVHTNDLRMHLTWCIGSGLGKVPWLWHQRVLLSGSPLWRVLGYRARAAICISNAVAATLPSHRKLPVSVIYNPADPVRAETKSDVRQQILRRLGLRDDVLLIGYVGNMTTQKRPEIFVDAAAILATKLSGSSHFLMYGDDRGGQLNRVRSRLAAWGISGQVHFMGYQSPIEPHIAALDVLLAPGVGDGFGRTLVEAMMVGTPVIASASGGHLEIIQDGVTGILVPSDCAEAFASAAEALLLDRTAYESLAARAQSYARETFGVAMHAQAVMSVYDRAIRPATNVGHDTVGENGESYA